MKAVAEGVAEQANRAENLSNENQSMSQTLSEEAVVQWQAKYKQSDPNPNPNPNWQAKYKQSEKLKERLLSCVSELEEKLNQSQASKTS